MAKNGAWLFGIVFLLVGLWGLFQNPVIGIFDANTLHSIIHLIFGVILVWVAWKAADKSAVTLKWVGIIYIILAIIGFVQGTTVLGIISVNAADNWLHLVLGIIMAALGFADKKSMPAPAM